MGIFGPTPCCAPPLCASAVSMKRLTLSALQRSFGMRSFCTRSESLDTVAIHGAPGQHHAHGAVLPPITTATTFVQPELGGHSEFSYSRVGNPTRQAYEQALAALERGTYATATSSGVAAAALALELIDSGSHVVVMTGVYGGTSRLFEQVRRRSAGLRFSFVDCSDLEALAASITDDTRMVWIESPTNPMLNLVDIQAAARTVKQQATGESIIFCVDNTFATAWNQQPLTLGADLVMLSSSKYIGGHSDMTGGALITSQPHLEEKLDFLKTCVGAVASPFDAYLALRGMKTLALRMERQCANALQMAEVLDKDDRVMQVRYPGLTSHPQYELCKRQMRTGGAVITVRLQVPAETEDTQEWMKSFFSGLRYFILAESLGGIESMINHSWTMSHASMSATDKNNIGIHDTTLRLSVGAENIDDLMCDFQDGLGRLYS